MLDRFQSTLRDEFQLQKGDTLLIALSGGIDSMVLWHLVKSANINYELAHCNFMLRGTESDADQAAITSLAKKEKAKLHLTSFDTAKDAEQKSLSIQMAARDLRYEWFETLRKDSGARYIVTAHHADDQLETFFINLFRGSGLSGLSGIPGERNHIIRPLLTFHRNEIEQYAKENDIAYREDSSNTDTKYLRNAIRHKLLPSLDEIDPQGRAASLKSIALLADQEQLLNSLMHQLIKKIVKHEGDQLLISIPKLIAVPGFSSLLHVIISDYGFNKDQLTAIISSLDSESGKVFLSNAFRLIKDRSELIIVPIDAPEGVHLIEEGTKSIQLPDCRISLEVKEIKHVNVKRTPDQAYFDVDEVSYPFTIRRWKDGDYFYPFETSGHPEPNDARSSGSTKDAPPTLSSLELRRAKKKKISKYFKDQKLSLPQKEREWIMAVGDRICWVVGRRTDHRFRLKASTKKVLVLRKIDKGER